MSETEKVTINLGPVDLGRLDILVEQGLYANRTDAIRTALRQLLDHHEAVISEVAVRRSSVVGALALDRSDLMRWKARGERRSLHVIGLLSLASDVDAELAGETIDSLSVRGIFRAPDAVKKALADRVR